MAGLPSRRAQKGQAIVLIAIMLAIVVGMAALAIDGARAYTVRRDLQAAVDAAALAAGDRMQQTGSYTSAEQAASANFGANLRLYGAPACSPGYGTPGAGSYTVTCTYADGTALAITASATGPQGSFFRLNATRTLQLQFARILTNGGNPSIAATAGAETNNQRFTPAVAALAQSGCGGAGGSAITVNGTGTLNVTGDVVAGGAVSVVAGSVRVAGDLYARCQSPVPGSVSNACYPSGASTPCSYPDVAGATRSGFRLPDPGYPSPAVLGGSQGAPNATVTLLSGLYAAVPVFNGNHCWFLAGGVYDWQAGYSNSADFVSNELKPPGEPSSSNNTVLAASQFWNTGGVNCAGGFQVTKSSGPRDVETGIWSFVVTSTRSDTYNGVAYKRESAPSYCQQVNLNNHFDDVQLSVSNVPGATAYNIYAAPPPNGCSGPFGLAATLAVTAPVLNTNTNPCPLYTGNGCSLGNESITLDPQLADPFAPNASAAPGTTGAYPPSSETAPLGAGMPNQNPVRGVGAAGDRANENDCDTVAGAWATCPAAITPGAVEFYLPSGACLSTTNGGDTYVFSGYQYDWISLYEPPANTCANTVGASDNGAYVGLVYAPSASIAISSQDTFDVAATAGVMASSITFTGSLPTIKYGAGYAPVPPASRISS